MSRLLIMCACLHGTSYVLADERYPTHRLPELPTEPGADDLQELDTNTQVKHAVLGADYLPRPTDNAPGTVGVFQGLLALDRAVEGFKDDFIRVLLDVPVQSVIHGKDFIIHFFAQSLAGIITFTQPSFSVHRVFKPSGSPTFAVIPNWIKINYTFDISRSLFHSLYYVDVTSINEKQMQGLFDARFGKLQMHASLMVSKEQGRACQYEVKFDISPVPKTYKSNAQVISEFRDSNLTKKTDNIVNKYVLEDLLLNKDLAIPDKFSQQLKEGVDKKVGETFRETMKKDLCDFM